MSTPYPLVVRFAPCDACDRVCAVGSLAGHPADDFPYDWLLCRECRAVPAAVLLAREV